MTDIIKFKKYITISTKNSNSRYCDYVSRWGNRDIKSKKNFLDEFCYFEVTEQLPGTNKIKLKLDNGNYMYIDNKYKLYSSRNINDINGKDIFNFIKIKDDNINGDEFIIENYNGYYLTLGHDGTINAFEKNLEKATHFNIKLNENNKPVTENVFFYVRKVHGPKVRWAENIGGYRFDNNSFRASYTNNDFSSVEIQETYNKKTYRFKFNGKYFKTEGHWIRSTESSEEATSYRLELNQDIRDGKDIHYIKVLGENNYLCMDSDGWFNVKNSGRYVLVHKEI